jgi:hypothetical protein
VIVGCVLPVLGIASLVRAGTPIDQTVPASPGNMVSVENLAGSVEIQGWDRDEISIQGTLGDGAEGVEVDRDEDEVTIEVVISSHRRRVDATSLKIRVPHRSMLEVQTVSADVEIEGVEGKLEIETVSGAIELQGSGGLVVAESVSGAIRVEGDFSRVDAESVSGSIHVDGAYRLISLSTTSGEIVVRGGKFTDVQCTSVSGRLSFEGELSPDADWEFENFSGETLLMIPGSTNAYLDVEVFSGSVRNEFGGRVRRPDHGPGGSLSMAIGSDDSDAEISINSFSGSVEIRKK